MRRKRIRFVRRRNQVGRREFLWTGVSGAALLLVGPTGCESPGTGPIVTPDAIPPGGSDGSVDRRIERGRAEDASRPDQLPPTCGELTEPNIEGPFFSPNSPERTQLRAPGMIGVPLRVVGKVSGRDCRPLPGALLDFWQADASGAYDNQGFTLRGHQYTAKDGSYRLETIIPGRYLNGATYRPSHIHVKVAAQGFLLLTTQLYFAGDPFNAIDPFIRSSLIMELHDIDGGKEARFDFVLAPSR